MFRAPGASGRLFDLQAIALAEIAQWSGGLVALPVGEGKTLIYLLGVRLVQAKRPLILLPAHLIEKTEKEAREYRHDWVLPAFYRMESYQALGRVSGHKLLTDYQPDWIFADEAHYLKNPDAACTRQVRDYVKAHDPNIVFLTGSPTGKSLRDFAHLTSWSLKRTNPLPEVWHVLDEWARAIDVDVPMNRRLAPGALSRFCRTPLEDPRRALGRKIFTLTPGIVTSRRPPLDVPLRIVSHVTPTDPAIDQAFERLRSKWESPDGEVESDATAVWLRARELASGFYSVWDPRPPEEWKDARRGWRGACRDVLQSNKRSIYSEEALVQHLDLHSAWGWARWREAHPDATEAEFAAWRRAHEIQYPEAETLLRQWQALEPTFKPNPKAVWMSGAFMMWVCDWLKEHGPALVWTDRPIVGRALADLTGFAYYGEGGLDAKTGRRSLNATPAMGSAILARRANESGLNLQAFSRNLVIDVPATSTAFEQLIGRTHRRGQNASLVSVDLCFGCIEDVNAFWKAHGRTQYAGDLTGQSQKLLQANLDGVMDLEEASRLIGDRWRKRG